MRWTAALRRWVARDPKVAGLVALLVVAVVLWVVVQRVFAKPLGGRCRSDMDCASLSCLHTVLFGHDMGSGTCVQSCSVDADCPASFVCGRPEPVRVSRHEKVRVQTPGQEGPYCRPLSAQ